MRNQFFFSTIAISGALVGVAIALGNDHRALKVAHSRASGKASFISMTDGSALPVTATTASPVSPREFFRLYAHYFGIRDVDRELRETVALRDHLGHLHTTFEQFRNGVQVFGGLLRSHQNERGEYVSANGHFFPISPKLNVHPSHDRQAAERVAFEAFHSAAPVVDKMELVIVDPGWYGDRPQGARLAWYVRMSDWAAGKAEAFFVDAHSGFILDRWDLVETAINRRIHNGNNNTILPGPVARIEGQSPTFDDEVNRAYDFAGDTYDYYQRSFGRDSFSGTGSLMIATANSVAPAPCPNAFWNGTQTAFCTGLMLDDVVGHEFTHAVVQYTANLIYQNQPGQLNESYADVFGELIDLFNGNVSLPGSPAGPNWPSTPSGSGIDTSNAQRTQCIGGVRVDLLSPAPVAGSYNAGPASFGPQLTQTGISGALVQASPATACGTIQNAVAGNIVLIDRGGCGFTDKVIMAENAGAIGVIVANDREGPLSFLPGNDSGIGIPSVGITQEDGQTFRDALTGGAVTVKLAANDTSGVRWLVAEDGFGNQFRDMWMPSCMGDPDSANHPFQTCSPFDNGGVHSGSGVPNHAFALVTDGGTFRGTTVQAIGAIKAGAVWYRALTTYLTEVSDFEDAYAGLTQAASDLVGTFPRDPRTGFPANDAFTAHDAQQVTLALQAVEMNTPGRCGSFDSVLSPEPFEACHAPVTMYFDDFENGGIDWTVSNTNPPTPYDWSLRAGLPGGMDGTAWFIGDPDFGDCGTQGEAAVHSLFSPVLYVWDEAREIVLGFTHRVATEPAYDGGNVSISVNFGPFELLPVEAFRFNGYNAAIPVESTNPLAGQPAFTGRGAVWGTSYIDLTNRVHASDLVQFRFDFGKDACGGEDGWYISDISLFFCVPQANGDFDFDHKITLADVAQFENCMLTSVRSGGPCVPADLDGSGFITFLDFTPFIKLFEGP